jgi:hypothetical protein
MEQPDEGTIKRLRRRIEDALRKIATYEDLVQIAKILRVKMK